MLWAQGVKIPLQIFWERAAYRQLTSVASTASAKNPKQQHQQSWSSEIDLTLNIFLPSSNVDGVVVADSVTDFGFPFKQCTLKFEKFKMQEKKTKFEKCLALNGFREFGGGEMMSCTFNNTN